MDHKIVRSRLAAASLVTLAACGGGGGGSGGTSAAGAAAPSAAGGDLTVSGTAVERSAPQAGAAVAVKCASGNGAATTGADGSYAAVIPNGVAPCVLELAGSAGKLRSLVAAAAGGRATANITPLSELLTAQVAGGSAAALFSTFDGAAQAKVGTAAFAQAKADLEAALASKVQLAGLDPVTGAMPPGGAVAAALDALAATLATAGLTLDQLSATLLANQGSPAAVETVIQPRAANCAGLRSGSMRAIGMLETDPAFRTQVIQVDAGTLAVRESDGSISTFTDNGSCEFGTPYGTLLVSRGGFAVFRPTMASGGVSILIPEQKLALAELAGTWNALEYSRDVATKPFEPFGDYFTLDAAGKVVSSFTCVGLGACTADPVGNDAFTVDPDGGFRAVAPDGVLRLFAYRNASGAIIAVALYPNQRGIVVATKQVEQALPSVGDVIRNRNFTINATGAGSAISALETRTVIAVDAATQSYTRVRQSDGLIDGFRINSPRIGLFYRPAGTSPLNGGGTAPISEIVLLPLPGGASVFTSATAPNNFFGFSITPP